MKRIIITSLFTMFLSYAGIAQTRPQQSALNLNPSFLNPAATGIEDYSQLRLGLNKQWVGIDGAPSTAWVNGEMRLKTKADEQQEDVISKGHGIGLNLYYDKIGPYTTLNLNLGYAYHLPLSQGLVLSAGFAGGLRSTRYDIAKSLNPDQPGDPAAGVQASLSKKYTPDLNAGLLLNGKNFFAGVSMMQIISSKFVDVPESESKYRGQLLSSLGYVFRFEDQATSLWLSGVVKSDFANPLLYDINAKLWYKNLGWIGSTYIKDDAVGAGFGVNIIKSISISYLYEWGVSKHISAYSKGSHVLCIGFKLLKDNQSGMPKMGW
ncbi:PorP/SprF family type IX secretion system membrane protein [Chitinophaga arvensicola]|uniref:Type IX secretion system membrane protein, PorP/SprF family n=1 Tax=Chitinophaga arvensicola TaxID=29529 RepID=A0A1I0RX86_9BACT|nr:type IX secretion system membrane protein PorP/SprF [Chitinophaga arvensicola]SEW45433.1 type IX secretion system membrane protein, PorP/SprF family [Chitinophaga arvensicola]